MPRTKQYAEAELVTRPQSYDGDELVRMVRRAIERGVPVASIRRNMWAVATVAAIAAGVSRDEELERIVKGTCGSFKRDECIRFFSSPELHGNMVQL